MKERKEKDGEKELGVENSGEEEDKEDRVEEGRV